MPSNLAVYVRDNFKQQNQSDFLHLLENDVTDKMKKFISTNLGSLKKEVLDKYKM